MVLLFFLPTKLGQRIWHKNFVAPQIGDALHEDSVRSWVIRKGVVNPLNPLIEISLTSEDQEKPWMECIRMTIAQKSHKNPAW